MAKVARKKNAKPSQAKNPMLKLEALCRRLEKLIQGMEAGKTQANHPKRKASSVPGKNELAELPFFSKLSAQEYDIFTKLCELRVLNEGQLLFAEGDEGDQLFIVIEGCLEIFKRDVLGDRRLVELKPGGIVGEMALIEGKARSANVRAVSPSKVLAFNKRAYETLKTQHPAVATKLQDEILRLFSARLRETTEKMLGRNF